MNILTIVPEDGFIRIDNNFLTNIESEYLTWIPENVHAVQWDKEKNLGEIEFKLDSLGNKPSNEKINNLGIYSQAITTFEEELQRRAQAEADELASIEQNIDYWENLRSFRNLKLSKSDWTQLEDTPFMEEQKHLWTIYRQELRDLPENIEDPKPLVLDENHSSWPIPPS
jgi:hypothetical protein